MLWDNASCYACFEEQGHLWVLAALFRLCKTSRIFLHDPVCPKTGPVLSKNLVRSVLKPGPFCLGPLSVLSLDVVRFVLKRGPFSLVRFVYGPFCPRRDAEVETFLMKNDGRILTTPTHMHNKIYEPLTCHESTVSAGATEG